MCKGLSHGQGASSRGRDYPNEMTAPPPDPVAGQSDLLVP